MNEQVESIVKHPAFIPAITGAASFVVGVGAGYLLRKHQEPEYEEVVREDVILDETVEYSMTFSDEGSEEVTSGVWERLEVVKDDTTTKPPPVVVDADYLADKGVDFVKEKIQSLTPPDDSEEEVPQPEHHNVFAASTEDWNYEEELKGRSADAPYILHVDEFMENESGYTQSTLTYYAGDRILVDEQMIPIYLHEKQTGPLNFGHGSNDPNILYVRNVKSRGEYEIIRDPGLYSREVEGLEIEDNLRVTDLKHSNGPHRFHPD